MAGVEMQHAPASQPVSLKSCVHKVPRLGSPTKSISAMNKSKEELVYYEMFIGAP